MIKMQNVKHPSKDMPKSGPTINIFSIYFICKIVEDIAYLGINGLGVCKSPGARPPIPAEERFCAYCSKKGSDGKKISLNAHSI